MGRTLVLQPSVRARSQRDQHPGSDHAGRVAGALGAAPQRAEEVHRFADIPAVFVQDTVPCS